MSNISLHFYLAWGGSRNLYQSNYMTCTSVCCGCALTPLHVNWLNIYLIWHFNPFPHTTNRKQEKATIQNYGKFLMKETKILWRMGIDYCSFWAIFPFVTINVFKSRLLQIYMQVEKGWESPVLKNIIITSWI